MKRVISIFVNQRFWKEIEVFSVDPTGALDFRPALEEVYAALPTGAFEGWGVRTPQELVSVELRANYRQD